MVDMFSGKQFHTHQGGVHVNLFNPEGIKVDKIETTYEGFMSTDEIFDKYFECSLFNKIGVPEKFLKKVILEEENHLAEHEYLWDGDSLPMSSFTVEDGIIVDMSFYGRKYSFSTAVQSVWVGLPENVKKWALTGNIDKSDGMLSGGFGVQGLIHTADDKMLTTVRTHNAINNGGLIMTSFNEGAGLTDVKKNTVDIMNMFIRGMKEELNITDLTNIKITPHTFMLDTRLYEWGFLAYVDATDTVFTSDKLEEVMSAAKDSWENIETMFDVFNPETIKKFVENNENWVSHALICAAFSGMVVHPQLKLLAESLQEKTY